MSHIAISALVATLVVSSAGCGPAPSHDNSAPGASSSSSGGQGGASIPDGRSYCNGAADCANGPACTETWCVPVRDEPNQSGRSGVCEVTVVGDGAPCAVNTGTCVAGSCVTNGPPPPVERSWVHEAVPPFTSNDFYRFVTTDFAPNVDDAEAFRVYVNDAEAGGEMTIRVSGYMDPALAASGAACEMQVHVETYVDGASDRAPISEGGHATEQAAEPSEVTFEGVHRVTTSGVVVVRLLGRVTLPSTVCAFGGNARLDMSYVPPS